MENTVLVALCKANVMDTNRTALVTEFAKVVEFNIFYEYMTFHLTMTNDEVMNLWLSM